MIESGLITEVVEREVSPFAAVIESYRKHARRTSTRTAPVVSARQFRGKIRPVALQPRVKATIYYLGCVNQLESYGA